MKKAEQVRRIGPSAEVNEYPPSFQELSVLIRLDIILGPIIIDQEAKCGIQGQDQPILIREETCAKGGNQRLFIP